MEHTAQDDLLGRLLDRVAALEGEVKTLRGANAEPAVERDDDAVSRRGLLKKVAGAMAAGVAAAAVGNALGASPAAAANGDPMIVGAIHDASSGTRIYNDAGQSYAWLGDSTYGVLGSTSGDGATGVRGHSLAPNGTGVEGIANGDNGTGVEGTANGHYSSTAVRGLAQPQGYGVVGSTESGVAIFGEATSDGGYGLQVKGVAVFSRSGKVAIPAGQTSKVVSVSLSPASLVLATIQGDPAGTWVKSVSLNVTKGKFTIQLNKAAPSNVTVGWFVVN